MNTEIKIKWTKALRSDKYRQCQYILHNPILNEYCCLGVLRRVADIPISINEIKLTSRHLAQLGLKRDQHDALIQLNDTLGHSFFEIADWIERNL